MEGKKGKGLSSPERRNGATAEGCTLAQYSEQKGLPVPFLHSLGLTDYHYQGRPAVRIPYRNEQGEEIAVRFRIALAKSASLVVTCRV